MKKVLSMVLALVFLLAFVLSGCGSAGANSEKTATTAPAASTAAQTTAEPAKQWPIGPNSELLPKPWDNLPELSVDYTYRQSPASEQREMVGNMYKTGWPLVKDTVTLKVLVPQTPTTQDYASNFLTVNMEKKMNVHIEWNTAPQNDFQTKRNLVLAGGDLPDIILSGDFTKQDEMTYGDKEGTFIPLNDLIDQYGDWIKKTFEVRPEIKPSITTPTGKIYSLPCVYINYQVQYQQKAWINQTWLQNVNMQMPASTDELEKVLLAFKTQDPNKNQKADEMPLVGSPKGWNTDIRNYMVNPFILNVNPNHLIVENGKVASILNRPEYRDALNYIHKLYTEKLIDKESFARDKAQLQQVGNNPDVAIAGMSPAAYVGGLLKMDSDRAKEYTCMPPLKGPSGNAYTWYDPFQYIGGEFVITNACKTPEVALRWADFFFSPEGDFAANYGRLGTEWKYADKGQTNLFGEGQAVFSKLVELGTEPQNITYFGITLPGSEPLKEFYAAWASKDGALGYDAVMTKFTNELYKGHEMPEIMPNDMYIALDSLDEYGKLSADLKKIYDETSVNFIINGITDKSWQDYTATLDKVGIKRFVEINQAAYDTYKKALGK